MDRTINEIYTYEILGYYFEQDTLRYYVDALINSFNYGAEAYYCKPLRTKISIDIDYDRKAIVIESGTSLDEFVIDFSKLFGLKVIKTATKVTTITESKIEELA